MANPTVWSFWNNGIDFEPLDSYNTTFQTLNKQLTRLKVRQKVDPVDLSETHNGQSWDPTTGRLQTAGIL